MYKPREIILKSGEKVVLRQPNLNDAGIFADFINGLVDEETFEYSGKQTIEDEKEYIRFLISETESNKGVHIIATYGGEKIAGADLTNCGYKKEHVVEMQIYVRKDFRGKGLGTILIEELENEEEKLNGIKIIILTSFGNNHGAIRFYEKFGYRECGRVPGVLKHKESLVDEVYMYKKISNS